MVQLSIIIPIWNLWDMTKNCLESIAEHTQNFEGQLEVIVVDNGSTDATTEALVPTLQRLFGNKSHALILPENRGFAKACNIGAKAAKAELLFFLNNDTLLTQNCLTPLLQAFKSNNKLGMVTPLLLYPNDTIQHAGISFTHTLEPIHAYHLLPANYGPVYKTHFWQAITGAALLIPNKIFEECGGFYEGYINGFEDLDLCCQVRSKGLYLQTVPQSRIYHLTSQTPGRFNHDNENAALLGQRHPGAFRPDRHSLALEDGLTPLLSPDLELYISLPQAKERALTQAFTQNFNLVRCNARLEAEPYWIQGYEIIAQYLEQHNEWAEALNYRLPQTHLAPLQEHFLALANCAAHCGREKIAQSAQQGIQSIQQKLQNITALTRKAQALRNWAQQIGDTALEQLFDTWFNTYTQQ